jgi:hypothetical protein
LHRFAGCSKACLTTAVAAITRTPALPIAVLSAFSVFFTQSPSFLDYRVRMQKQRGRNNAQSLFGVHQIPSDNQIRNLRTRSPRTACVL